MSVMVVKFDSVEERNRFMRGIVGCSIHRNPPENARWCEIRINESRIVRQRADRFLLIGQAPRRIGRADRPLIGGKSGEFLRELTGLTLLQYARRFERCNLLSAFPGSAPTKGDLFPSSDAVKTVKRMLPTLVGRQIVLVGRAAAIAFELADLDFYRWVNDERGFSVAVIPHPSCGNLHWNKPGAKAEAIGFFSRMLFVDDPDAR